jgi:hypothetical protein
MRAKITIYVLLAVLLSGGVAGSQSPAANPDKNSPTTIAAGVNDVGVVVGTYIDTSNVEHGFIYSAGAFNSVDVPGASGVVPTHVTNKGQLVGYAVDHLKENHGLTAH